MQLSELVAQVEDNLGRDDKTTDIPTYINSALQRISTDYYRFNEWQEIASVEVDPNDVDTDPRLVPLPTNLRALQQVLTPDLATPELVRLTHEEYDSLFPIAFDEALRTTGDPTYYTVYSRYLEVYPVPTSTITYYLRGYKVPPTLTEDEDEPLIPYDELIIAGATMIALNRLGMREEGKDQYYIYKNYLQAAMGANIALESDVEYRLQGYRVRSRQVSSDRNSI